MSRRKIIDDPTLLDLIQNYFDVECSSNPNRLKLPGIADYIRRNGYPGYTVETLRRNKIARARVEELKATTETNNAKILVAYKTMNVHEFLCAHPTHESKIKALTRLDVYYEKIASAAAQAFDQMQSLRKENEKLHKQNQSVEATNHDLLTALNEAKKQIAALTAENNKYRTYISQYVYPDIANTLLQKAGVTSPTQKSTVVDPSKVKEHIISSETNVTKPTKMNQSGGETSKTNSRVIQGLFKPFESFGGDN